MEVMKKVKLLACLAGESPPAGPAPLPGLFCPIPGLLSSPELEGPARGWQAAHQSVPKGPKMQLLTLSLDLALGMCLAGLCVRPGVREGARTHQTEEA